MIFGWFITFDCRSPSRKALSHSLKQKAEVCERSYLNKNNCSILERKVLNTFLFSRKLVRNFIFKIAVNLPQMIKIEETMLLKFLLGAFLLVLTMPFCRSDPVVSANFTFLSFQRIKEYTKIVQCKTAEFFPKINLVFLTC